MGARNYSTLGVVLKRRNFGEADRILTIFTKHHGKIFAIAKGIRKITSKKAPSLEPFSYCKLFIVVGKNLELVTEAEIISSFPNLRKNLKTVAFAYQICEIIERLVPEKQINRSLFELLIQSFAQLEKNGPEANKTEQEMIVLKILWDMGYLPRNEILQGEKLSFFVESIMEKKLKSDQLLTRVEQLI